MAAEHQIKTNPSNSSSGPSGFIAQNEHMLVVDYGKVYLDGTPVGFLHEDGLMSSKGEPFGSWDGLKPIEQVPGCVFRGIDSYGQPLEFPTQRQGPSGVLTYNNQPLNVVCGRISTQNHELVGYMNDAGELEFYDYKNRAIMRKMDENSQLNTFFKGNKSSGDLFDFEYIRPLHKGDKSYSDNEMIRYFQDYDRLNSVQKKYVLDSLRLWTCAGFLQIVRKSEGNAAIGSIREGVSGLTGKRTGHVDLDRDEFEKEITLYKRFGPVAIVATRHKPYHEVRINLVVSHEFGHQLEFILSQATQDKIVELYEKRLSRSNSLYPLPAEYEGKSELLLMQQIPQRIFLSGYGRSSENEYWAEAVAAFSIPESRMQLKEIDLPMFQLIVQLLKEPENMVRPTFADKIMELRTSLKIGGELTSDLLVF
jgi:hypothetical protein